MDILDILKKGENKIIEFKETIPNGKTIAKTVIAFSNKAGGKIIIGINDNREIIGIDENLDIFKIKDDLSNIIYDSCYPSINYDIYTETVNNKIILIIEVFPGRYKPYYLKSIGKENGTYIRIGATNRKGHLEDIIELERQKENISYDEEIEYNKILEEFDILPLKNIFSKMKKELSEEKLLNMGLIKKLENKLFLSKGLGIILGLYENTNIDCARFKGNNMDIFLDKKEFNEDIFSNMKNIQNFLQNHLNIRSEFNEFKREDILEIPLIALREGIINALIHRDYSKQGRNIKIGIYDDRVEILSPGSLPSTLTIEDIFNGRSEIRNKILARVFKELNFIERWGSGINRMKNLCKNSGLKIPKIEEKGDSVLLTFFREMDTATLPPDTATLPPDTATLPPDTATFYLRENLNDQEKIIVNFIGNNLKTRKDIEENLNLSSRRVREILKNLKDKEIIVMIGNGRNIKYKLKTL